MPISTMLSGKLVSVGTSLFMVLGSGHYDLDQATQEADIAVPATTQITAAMPDDGAKIKVKELCDKLEIKGTTFSKYRERLINKGVCTAPEYGYIALALPRFKNITASYDIEA